MIFNPPPDHPQALPFGVPEMARQYNLDNGLTPEKRAELLKLCEEAEARYKRGDWPFFEFYVVAREWLPRLLASPPVAPEAGLETTAEEREQWLHSTLTLGESKRRILRDFDRILTALSQARADLKRAQLIDSEGRIVNPTEWLSAQLIAREVATREEEREVCGVIAAADVIPDCGLPKDWPQDKPCPQCGDLGTDGSPPGKCPGLAGRRIAAAIRARSQS